MERQASGAADALHGKVAVVTGAARGIGRATAVAFPRNFVKSLPVLYRIETWNSGGPILTQSCNE